jgi:hypothetical protein
MLISDGPEFAKLRDPKNEEADPLAFRIAAVALLLNALRSESQLQSTALYRQVIELFEFINANPSDKTDSEAEMALLDLEWLATVGKALAHVGSADSPQFRREFLRFATDPDAAGNQFLFYIVATLGSRGYAVEFVPERGSTGEKTPDLKVTKGEITVWIEVNAKQPQRQIDSPERVRQLIRDIIFEKKQKFTAAEYSPGMIVADISPALHLANETGLPPVLKLRPDLCGPHPNFRDGFIYRLYEDSDWQERPENQGNVFSVTVEEFLGIDRSRYHVSQCLLALTRRVWRDGRAVAFPKAHQLIAHRTGQQNALVELSKHVYIVG